MTDIVLKRYLVFGSSGQFIGAVNATDSRSAARRVKYLWGKYPHSTGIVIVDNGPAYDGPRLDEI
jgi:hypothetical protein